jgi:hypothetical protein
MKAAGVSAFDKLCNCTRPFKRKPPRTAAFTQGAPESQILRFQTEEVRDVFWPERTCKGRKEAGFGAGGCEGFDCIEGKDVEKFFPRRFVEGIEETAGGTRRSGYRRDF